MYFRLSLNHLNTFACAARYESFQQAAEQLNVTPSAVSHQVRQLEQQLGYTLFKRLDRQVRLTDAGLTLFQQLNQPLHQLHSAAEQALTTPHQQVKISCAPLYATRWLMPRLPDFRARFPDIEISIQATTEQVALESYELDGLIRHGAHNWPQMHQLRLLDEQPVIACRPALLRRLEVTRVTAELLQHQPLVDIAAHPDRWQAWFHQQGINADRRLCRTVVQNAAQAIDACLFSDLFLLLDRTPIERELADGSLVVVAEPENHEPYGLSLLWSKQRRPRAAFLTFHDWLQRFCQG
ncbi:MAG: LysR substrate-binding domain-containing protein [Marinobacterium sp.]|nr:LysR substrate-binding domain-containing protein [Marinobacterium sp.]